MDASTFSPSFALTLLFATALLLGLLTKFWLAARQIRHIAHHRGTVPAAYAGAISLAAHQKAADYNVTKLRFGLLESAFSSAVLLGWTLLGGLDALNQALLGWMGAGMGQQLALITAFVVVGGLIELPFSLYQTFVIEQRFGFNKMSFKLWLSDLVKGSVLGAAIGLPIAALVLWFMGTTGALWWLWAWCAWMGFNLLLLWIYPTFIAPLFNKFQPLEDASLKERVTALMQRCGFQAQGLYVMDGSRRSAHANAYFTGFGRAKRVVFFDTLLNKLSPGEVDAVLAHELGHFKHKHILKRIVMMFTMSLAGFALLGWLAQQAWFYTGLGVTPSLTMLAPALGAALSSLPAEVAQGFASALGASNDALALLLFLLVAPVFSFFITPLMARGSRQHEFEADAYAARQAERADLASALLKLYEDNAATLTPDPLYVAFYYSHPPASQRLARLGLDMHAQGAA
ncbi:peptidase M48 [Hylemonella gracilis str. Niagara R]|uniref:Peptidase M48 n=1 Tax=Hylemonella gracilis str. Niagara R TaxID=1458275 RepID=A0A016XJQ4_9BURK|nr:M48 family metallopeptidase [Hylemonella gracilis]EYC51802.1 peptidase M48 [Hylemonella gracilis str. Niagara R]